MKFQISLFKKAYQHLSEDVLNILLAADHRRLHLSACLMFLWLLLVVIRRI